MSSEDSFDVGKYTIPRSDQLNAEDFLAGPVTFTVRHVREKGGTEQPVEIFLEEVDRPWRPCKTMMRVLAYGWGPQTGAWRGRQATLYRDPSVKWGGAEVGGIRVKAMSDLTGELARGFVLSLTKSKGAKAPIEVRPIRRETSGPVQEPRRPDPAAMTLEAESLRAKARLAALQGTVTFREFWARDDVKPHRAVLQGILEECKALAAEADAKGAPREGDPFSGGAEGEPREREPGEEG